MNMEEEDENIESLTEQEREEISEELIKRGNDFEFSGEYENALEMYINILDVLSNKISKIIDSICLCLKMLGDEENDKILEYYDEIQKDLPIEYHGRLLIEKASYFYNLGNQYNAILLLNEAQRLNPNDLNAIEGIDNLKNEFIERWHFRMLNDFQRNINYNEAIKEAIMKKNVGILDIGTGTGILSMLCKTNGGMNISSCERNEAMYCVAKDCIYNNNMSNDINLLYKSSYDIEVGKDIKDKVNLIVTEIIDAGLLGEEIVPTLRDAQKRLLNTNGIIIPYKGEMICQLIQSDELRRRWLSTSNTRNNNNEIPFTYRVYEPYTCEEIRYFNYENLSDEFVGCSINFNTPGIPLPHNKYKVKILKDGEINAILGYVNLYLDEKHIVTTSYKYDVSWEQAIYPIEPSVEVKSGDIIEIEVIAEDKAIKFNIIENDKITIKNISGISIELNEIVLLNDEKYHNEWSKVINNYLSGKNDIKILDMCGGSSILSYLSNKINKNIQIDVINLDPFSCDVYKQYNRNNNNLSINCTDKNLCNTIKYLKKYNFIYHNPVGADGRLQITSLGDWEYSKEYLLEENGKCIPESIELYGMIIECEEIRKHQRVDSKNTLGYNLESINCFSVNIYQDFPLYNWNYKRISNVIPFLLIDGNKEQYIEREIDIVEDGIANALVYWWKYNLSNDSALYTFDLNYSGNYKEKPHWNQSAFILNENKMKMGEKIKISCLCKENKIHFEMK